MQSNNPNLQSEDQLQKTDLQRELANQFHQYLIQSKETYYLYCLSESKSKSKEVCQLNKVQNA
jgi:hypothetical protein